MLKTAQIMGSCGSKPGEAATLASKGTPGSALPIDPALAKKIEAVRASADALTSPQKRLRASTSSATGEVRRPTHKVAA